MHGDTKSEEFQSFTAGKMMQQSFLSPSAATATHVRIRSHRTSSALTGAFLPVSSPLGGCLFSLHMSPSPLTSLPSLDSNSSTDVTPVGIPERLVFVGNVHALLVRFFFNSRCLGGVFFIGRKLLSLGVRRRCRMIDYRVLCVKLISPGCGFAVNSLFRWSYPLRRSRCLASLWPSSSWLARTFQHNSLNNVNFYTKYPEHHLPVNDRMWDDLWEARTVCWHTDCSFLSCFPKKGGIHVSLLHGP